MSRIQPLARPLARRRAVSSLRNGCSIRGKSSIAQAFASDPESSIEFAAGPSTHSRTQYEATPSAEHLKSLTVKKVSERWTSPKGKERERVVYKHEDAGVSMEKRAFFTGEEPGGSAGLEGVWSDAEGGMEEHIAGLEPGRVVECRRSGTSGIGLLLASVLWNGRQRLILLRQSGEIWPISPNDVQFVMPPSLIPLSLAQQCWSSDLIEAWAKGDESMQHEVADGEMMAARRQAVVILRKVAKETEKMVGRLTSAPSSSGFRNEGVEGVWEEWTLGMGEDERGRITAAEAAAFLLSSGPEGAPTIKNNTLPAYAAHKMLMGRPDLFIADEGDMWASGVFLVRSKSERVRLQTVGRWVDGTTAELETFVHKCRSVLASAPSSPIHWSPSDQTLISILFLRLYETRTTQHSPSDRLSVAILRAIDPYPGVIADQASIGRLLIDLGCLPITDSLSTSKVVENELREIAQSNPQSSHTAGELFKGTELDTLREDFSSHTVWVIDDPTAKELDDGISLVPVGQSGDVWAHVHIADPTEILPIDHALAIRASFRGTALYLPEGNTPLIDLGAMKQGLSLGSADGEGGQSVMTFSALLSANGEIKDTSVKLGWIKKPRLTSYEDVDAAFGVPRLSSIRPFGRISPLSTEPPPTRSPLLPAEIPNLKLLRDISTACRSRRLALGGLEWSLPLGTPSLISPPPPTLNFFSPSSIPSQTTPFPSFPLVDYSIPPGPPASISATSAVAEMMMLAGRVAAQFCAARGIPVPYRGAGLPQQLHVPGLETMSVDELLSHRQPNGNIDPFSIWRSRVVFAPSTVGTNPLPHWNMGLVAPGDGYTRPTSPLRRYDDFLVHWQIKSYFAKQAGVSWGRALDVPEVEAMTKRISGAQIKGKRAMKNAEAYWQAGLFGQRLQYPRDAQGDGEVDLREGLKARVTGATITKGSDASTPVHIPALGAMARMTSRGGWEIGDEVDVRVTDAAQWPAPLVRVVPA